MQEQEWLTSSQFATLYHHLKRRHNVALTRAGRRRLLLLACAVCRHVLWQLPVPDVNRRVVEAAEALADGRIGLTEKAAALAACSSSPFPGYELENVRLNAAANALLTVLRYPAGDVVWRVSQHIGRALGGKDYPEAQRIMSALLRDVFANPFRPLPELDAGCLSRDGGQVRRLAQAIYAESAFEQLPILADALEDYGCTDAAVLTHLRNGGPHVRGCWALDLLAGNG